MNSSHSSNQLHVYGDYYIDYNKYPRKDEKSRIIDIMLINYFMYEEYLKKISMCYKDAYQNYNECKDYFFLFEFSIESLKLKKNYEAREIINIMKDINFLISSSNNIEVLQQQLKRKNRLDVILYFYLKNKDHYMNIFESLEKAKIAYFQGKEYQVKFDINQDFYSYNQAQIYSALELIEIYVYTQYLLKRKIKLDLPIPKYLIN
jgi:hypothetical protein